jgi:hypothetical protein
VGRSFKIEARLYYLKNDTSFFSTSFSGIIERGGIHLELPASDFKILSAEIKNKKLGEKHFIRKGLKDENCRMENCTWVECHFKKIFPSSEYESCSITVKRIGFEEPRLRYFGWLQNSKEGKVFCYPGREDNISYKTSSKKKCRELKIGPLITYPRSDEEVFASIRKPLNNLIKKPNDIISINAELKHLNDVPVRTGGIIIALPSDNLEVINVKSESIYAYTSKGTNEYLSWGECKFQPFSFKYTNPKSSRFCTVNFKVKSNAVGGKSTLKYFGWIRNSGGDKVHCYPPSRLNEKRCDTFKLGIRIIIPTPQPHARLSGLRKSIEKREGEYYVMKNPNELITLTPRLTNLGNLQAEEGGITVAIPKDKFDIISIKNEDFYGEAKKKEENGKYFLVKCSFPLEIPIGHQRKCVIKLSVKSESSGKVSELFYSGWLKNKEGKFFCYPSPSHSQNLKDVITMSEVLNKKTDSHPYSCEFMKRSPKIYITGPKPYITLIKPNKNVTLVQGDTLSIHLKLKNVGDRPALRGAISVTLPSKHFEVISAESKTIGSKGEIGSNKRNAWGICYFPYGIFPEYSRYCDIKIKAKPNTPISPIDSIIEYGGWVENNFGNKIFHSSSKIPKTPKISISIISKKNPKPEVQQNLITYKNDKVYLSAILTNKGYAKALNGGIHIELPSKYFKVISVKGGGSKQIKKGKYNKKCSQSKCVFGECYFEDIKQNQAKVCTVVFQAKKGRTFISAYPRYRGWLSNERGKIFCDPNTFGDDKCLKETKVGRKVIVDRRKDKGQMRFPLYKIKNCFK